MNFLPLDRFILGCLYVGLSPSLPFNHFRCPIRIFVEASW